MAVAIGVARYLSTEQFGVYSYIMALVGSIMAISVFGVAKILTREVARDKSLAARYTAVTLTITTTLLALSGGLSFVLAMVMELPVGAVAAVALAIAANVFLCYTQLFVGVFHAFEKMKYESVVTFVASVTLVTGLLSVIFLNLGFTAVFAMTALSGLAGLLASFVIILRKVGFPLARFSTEDLRWFFRESAVVGIGVFIYMNLFKIDVLLLKWLSGYEDVAYFQAAHNLTHQIVIFPVALMTAAFPRISRLEAEGDPAGLKTMYEKLFRFMFMGGATAALFTFCYAEEIITILLGEKFRQSAQTLMILSWSFVPLFADVFTNTLVVAMGRQSATAVFGSVGLAVNVLLGVALIPLYGQTGAAMAAFASYTALFVTSYIYITWHGDYFTALGRLMGRAFVAVAAGGCAMLLIKTVSAPLSFVVGCGVYLAVVLSTGVIRVAEIRDFVRKIRPRPGGVTGS